MVGPFLGVLWLELVIIKDETDSRIDEKEREKKKKLDLSVSAKLHDH